MKILYFAWVREKTGLAEEEVTLPDGVTDVAGLIDWLKSRGEGFTEAFETPDLVRCAVNQDHAMGDQAVSEDDEVAFFPPVTGG